MLPTYRKSYPAGAAGATARRHLLAVLRRAPGRRARWRTQAGRRRPWLLRPLTAGEQTLLRYRGLAVDLAGHLEPFRRTRLRGHEELYGLLSDADTRAAVVAQVEALRACLARIKPEYDTQHRQLERWRLEWPRLSVKQQQHLTQVDKAIALNGYHNGLHLLLAEARGDLATIERICPAAFVPAPAPEPWLDSSPAASPSTGPTPYS